MERSHQGLTDWGEPPSEEEASNWDEDHPKPSGSDSEEPDDRSASSSSAVTCDGQGLAHDENGRFCPIPGPKKDARVSLAGDGRRKLTAQQRFLALDCWLRSKLPAKDFGALVGVSKHTLYAWKKAFSEFGLAGLEDHPRQRSKRSQINEVTKRAILLLKESNPTWGVDRIHDVLIRSQGVSASASAISRCLKENGYQPQEVPTKPHPDKKRSFERSQPGELWQTDLFTFMLKRQNRRVHLVGYLDDYSRFIVGYGLHATASGALVREVLDQAISNYGAPVEILTDNGPQYVTWRGKSAFSKHLDKLGIRQVVARPRRPQTLGKIERFWGSLWRECVAEAIFQNFDDAKLRIGHFIDHYNFQRPHQGIDGLVPADRFFDSSSTVKTTLSERVAANALEIAKHGAPRKRFYLTGRVGDENISLHAEGARVVLTRDGQPREEVDLLATGKRAEPGTDTSLPVPVTVDGSAAPPTAITDDRELAPGESQLDEPLAELRACLVDVVDGPYVEDHEEDDHGK